jgi:RHS repeat-associated protein
VSTADGTVQYTFSGRDLQRTDMNGVTTITQADALGRTGSICEVSSSNLIGSDPSAPCGLDIAGSGLLTQFNYGPDATSGNQQSVIQQGQPQTRVFRTDAIGRPTVAFEPESGETDYTYAYNATGLVVTRSRPRANQSSSAQKTHTTTQYDALSRVASITYDDGLTPAKYYTYDQPAGWAEAQNYLKGRLSRVYTNIAGNWAGTIFSYDPVGRPAQIYECLPSRCGDPSGDRSLSTTFDWTGNVTGAADPVSGWITYGRSQAGEVTSVNQQSYTDPVNVPNLVTNVVNGPNGPISYSLGNGLNVYRSYDASGRLSSNWLCRGQAAANCNTQIFGDGGYWSGGRIVASDDTVMNVHGTYAYDEFNRLSSTTLSSGGTSQQTFSYGYDRWGNRWQQNAPQGGPSPNLSFNPANNQIQGLGYDAAGNLLNDGLGSSFEYDAEGNLLAISGNAAQQFAYDALNHRVWAQRGSTTEEYAYDYAGRRTSIWQPYSNIGTEGRIYWDGRQIAFRAQDGSTYFDHQDWTGTERMRTNYAGAIANTYGSLPFGDGYSVSSPGSWSDQDTLKYAALEADGAGTAHAEFRQYSTVHGRWMSPDPYSGSYDSSNPQSYNRYSYVSNSPISYVDPSGLFMAPPVPPEAAAACPWCAPVVIGADIIFGLFEFLSSRHHVAAPVSSRPSTGIWDEKINGISVQPTSNLNSVLGLPIGGCEFGACGGGADGFFQGRTPGQGQDPFEIQFIRDAAGKLIQIRLFNWAGKAWKDIDLHGHASQDYPQNPHQHRWDWNKTPPRGPGIWLVPIRIPGPFPVTIDPCLLSPTVCHQFPSNGGPA